MRVVFLSYWGFLRGRWRDVQFSVCAKCRRLVSIPVCGHHDGCVQESPLAFFSHSKVVSLEQPALFTRIKWQFSFFLSFR